MDIFFVVLVAILTAIGWLAPQAQYLTGGVTILLVAIYALFAWSERTQLNDRATIDRLSGFLNERGAKAYIERECALSQQTKRLLCVVTVDLQPYASSLPSDWMIAQVIAKQTAATEILVRLGERKFAVIVRDREALQVTEIIVAIKSGLSDPGVTRVHANGDTFKAPAVIEPVFYRQGEQAAAFIANVNRAYQAVPNKIDIKA
jgi:GGDEF domain-containing protein